MLDSYPKENQFIEVELCTDGLNEMMARCAEFIRKHPCSPRKEDVESMRLDLAIAHRKSRIYTDNEHIQQWNLLLNQAQKMLIEAEVINAVAG